jgi:hypothetical protein
MKIIFVLLLWRGCCSEEEELLFDGSDNLVGNDLESIESDGLWNGSALSCNEDVTFLNAEAGGDVDGNVSVSLLVSVVLADVVEIVSSYDNGLVHLGGDNESLDDLASDGKIGSEGAFLVNVSAFNSFLGCLESQTDVLVVSHTSWCLLSQSLLVVQEYGVLLLERSLNL